MWNTIAAAFDPEYAERRIKKQLANRLEKSIRTVTGTVTGLNNLSEYGLSWNQTRRHHPEIYCAFLIPVFNKIGKKLLRLTLDIPPELLRSLASVTFPCLEHLGVSFCTRDQQQREIDEIIDCFTLFVNNLYPTLQSLSISARKPCHMLDLTRLFTYLGTFPHLRKFSFTIPWDGNNLVYPSHLVAFLAKHHDTLQYLQLSADSCSAGTTSNPSSKFWIPNILASTRTPYQHLSGVRLSLRPLRADLTPVIRFLHEHSRDLKSLSLTDRPLTYNDVQSILDGTGATRGCLDFKHFHLRIYHLDSAFLSLLASRLPKLVDLELTFAKVKSGDYATSQREELVSVNVPPLSSFSDSFFFFTGTIRERIAR